MSVSVDISSGQSAPFPTNGLVIRAFVCLAEWVPFLLLVDL